MKFFKVATLLLSTLLIGCFESGLKGTYMGTQESFFEKLTFKSSNKVEIVFMGTTSEMDYKMEDNKIKIMNDGQNQILTITDEGCLDGGGFIGKYCKE